MTATTNTAREAQAAGAAGTAIIASSSNPSAKDAQQATGAKETRETMNVKEAAASSRACSPMFSPRALAEMEQYRQEWLAEKKIAEEAAEAKDARTAAAVTSKGLVGKGGTCGR